MTLLMKKTFNVSVPSELSERDLEYFADAMDSLENDMQRLFTERLENLSRNSRRGLQLEGSVN